MSKPKYYLVHWVNESKWDVYTASKIPSEHRYVGALCMLPWKDAGEYLGKVIAISSNVQKIEAEEAKLAKAIKEKEKVPQTEKRSSRERKKIGTASDNQVRKALGEKPKLTPEQEAAKKLAAAEKKKRDAARSNVEKSEDDKLLNSVKRKIDFPESTQQGQHGTETVNPSVASSSTIVHDLMTDEEASIDESDYEDGGAQLLLSSEVPTTPPQSVDTEKISESSDEENEAEQLQNAPRALKAYCNVNVEAFLRALMTEMGFMKETSVEPSTPINDKGKSSTPTEFASPLTMENQKMVPLKKGFKLLISKSGRNKLLVDTKSQKVSTVFTRKTLTELYGETQLRCMTALGRKKDKKGIPSTDLNAIYGFVNDHTAGKKMTWQEFITCVNKKCSSKSPKSSEKVEGSKKLVDAKSPKKGSPLKSPRKQTGRVASFSFSDSPLKSRPSPYKSPRKISTPLKSASDHFLVSDIQTSASAPPNKLSASSETATQQSQWLWPSQRKNATLEQSSNSHHAAATNQQFSSYHQSLNSGSAQPYQQSLNTGSFQPYQQSAQGSSAAYSNSNYPAQHYYQNYYQQSPSVAQAQSNDQLFYPKYHPGWDDQYTSA